MPVQKSGIRIFKNPAWQVAGILLLLFLAAFLLLFNQMNSTQSHSALIAQVRFYGNYRIGDGPWQPIVTYCLKKQPQKGGTALFKV